MKGHLDIRRLPLKTPNAIHTQLAIAVLVQLLLQLKKIISKFKGTLWELLREMRTAFARKVLQGCGPPDGCRWSAAAGEDLAL
ncbi:MAG: hypothetical protein IPJ84_14630 [Bdellovibrionales bacterium]|nr:hypothetical protein [Bdellovibrionales bacterium]